MAVEQDASNGQQPDGNESTWFTLRNGKRMQIDLNFTTNKLVQQHCGIDLWELYDSEDKLREIRKPHVFVDICFCLCEQSCQTEGIDDVEFGRNFDGRVLDAADRAFQQALINFYPEQKRKVLQALIEKEKAIQAALTERTLAQLDSPEMEAAMEAQVDELEKSFLNVLASSGSRTPGD